MRIRLLLLLACLCMYGEARASFTTTMDANGTFMSLLEKPGPAYTSSSGIWYQTGASSPNAAGVVVGRNIAVGAGQGANVAGKIPVLLTTEFTAEALAKSAVAGLRGGLPGIVGGLALSALFEAAHIAFDKTTQSMVYNPPPTNGPPTPGGGCWIAPSGKCVSSLQQAICEPILANPDYGTCSIGAATYTTINNVLTGSAIAHTGIGDRGPFGAAWQGGLIPGQPACPNGVQFNFTTLCRELVDDGKAVGLTTPHIDHQNGPGIGKDVSANNGIQFQPSGGVTPSIGPGIAYDPNSWPQVSGAPAQQFGPQTTTTTADHTAPGVGGNPGVTTTTSTTVTNTTNVTNNYSNNTTTTTINNKTETMVCDAAGVCTNDTKHSGDPSGGATPETPPEDVKVCGLPSTPPCKIDETGTPTSKTQAEMDATVKTQTDAISSMVSGGINAPPASDKIYNWLPTIPTAACVNPTIPHAIDGRSDVSFDMCAKYDFWQNFIAVIVAVLAMIAGAAEVRAAMRA